tara:strand:+ start:36313 stop:36831 length:519 start_codon:yes stop_codon:yes gene_type:complete
MEHLKKYISDINDFPKEGIVFKDINPIYKEPKLWKEIMLPLEKLVSDNRPDYIAGIESRGFITASALAFKNEIGFIPIRKPNKLPGKVISINYQLEYGVDTLEVQEDLFKRDSKIMLFDDLLATGGTASAAGKLIRKAGGQLVGFAFLIELTKLMGRDKLDNKVIIESVIKY